MKKYSIGKFAQYEGVTPDLMKYYEKNGILRPHVEENGYRYYDASSSSILNECIKYRNMQFSASDIHHLIYDCDYDTMQRTLNGIVPELETRVTMMNAIIRYANTLSEELPRFQSSDCWDVHSIDNFKYLPSSIDFDYVEDDEVIKIAGCWKQFQPAVLVAARVDLRSLRRHEGIGDIIDMSADEPVLSSIEWGNLVENQFIPAFDLPTCNAVIDVPKRKYLVVYDRHPLPEKSENNNAEAVKLEMFQKTIQLLRQHHFRACGPSYFIVRSKITENNQRYTYQKVLTPLSTS